MSMQVRSSEPDTEEEISPGRRHSRKDHSITHRGTNHLNHAREGLGPKQAGTSPGRSPDIITDSSPKSSAQCAEWTKS